VWLSPRALPRIARTLTATSCRSNMPLGAARLQAHPCSAGPARHLTKSSIATRLDALSGQNLHKRVKFSNWPLEASRPRRARAKQTLSSDAQRHCERGPASDTCRRRRPGRTCPPSLFELRRGLAEAAARRRRKVRPTSDEARRHPMLAGLRQGLARYWPGPILIRRRQRPISVKPIWR
jgi:hypothetical protein